MPSLAESTHQCPLCANHELAHFHTDAVREYYRCPECLLISVPEAFHPTFDEAKQRYDLHQNEDSIGYRRFLSQLSEAIIDRIPVKSHGLDYGSGPNPLLSKILMAADYQMDGFDLHYANDETVFQNRYDFIVCCETIEHFENPREEWERFLRLITPNGRIAVMTTLYHDGVVFSNWHYMRDETHVCFFSRETFKWLAERYQLKVEFVGKSVMIFQRHDAAAR